MGGGAPCAVQSMLNYALNDVAANVEQIKRLREAGCEIIRIAIPSKKDLDFFESICEQSPLPVVADIHFSAEIAIEAARRVRQSCVSILAILVVLKKRSFVIEAAKAAGIPIRIGS